MRLRLCVALLAGLACSSATATERIVSVAGSLTEIVYALGEQDRLLAVDTTSSHPPAARQLPSVGYQRTLSAEGILAQAPTLVLATEDAGPPAVLAQLRAAGIRVEVLDSTPTVAAALARIRAVAAVLDRRQAGDALAAALEQRLQQVQAVLENVATRPRVMFFFTPGYGAPLVAGRDTAPGRMIELAGGINVTDSFSGYRPFNAEAVIAAAPDVLLLPDSTLASIGGLAGLRRMPGLSATPAVRTGRVFAIDHLYLVGFSTRLADAVHELAAALHPELEWDAP